MPQPDIHDVVSQRLAAVNQRYPSNRRRLIEAMLSADKPLSVPELLRVLGDDMAQSSVYRNLDHLVAAGIVVRLMGSDDNGRFELTEDLVGDHHHHLVCRECGTVLDVASNSRLEKVIQQAAVAAEDEYDFEVSDHRIDLVGLCRNCR